MLSFNKQKIKAMIETYAKTRKDATGKTALGQTVLEHCIAVGEVAKELAAVKHYNKFKPDAIGFICALHDIGKITLEFQWKLHNAIDPEEASKLFPNINKDAESLYSWHSGAASYILSVEFPRFKELVPIIDRHHGYTPENCKSYGFRGIKYLKDKLYEERKKLVEELEAWFKPSKIPHISGVELDNMSGLLAMSDWIVSQFLYDTTKEDINNKARDVVRGTLGLSEEFIKDKSKTFKDLFGFNPYPAQQKVIDAIDDYGFYLVEQQTGKGKTEMALYATYKLICSGKCSGLYYGLPTQVTSNAAFIRVEEFFSKVTGKNYHGKLVHSNADVFLSTLVEKQVDTLVEETFFDFKHCRLFGNVITGTLDQALMAMLNFKFNFVREFSLRNKVIVIDEIHSYDIFTTTIIKKLAEFCKENDCVIIALSATVSDELKKEMFNKQTFSQAYPLLTYTKDSGFFEIPIDKSPKQKTYNLHVILEGFNEALRLVKEGKHVLWIENTMKSAQNICKKFKEHANDCMLLHSHFTQTDRLKKEKECLEKYGKNGECPAKGSIVVATQVMEQSLDVDFDVLFTKICPPDAFGQRCGRIGRKREGVFDIYVVCSDVNAEKWFIDKKLEEYDGIIYPPHVLYSFYYYIKDKTEISYPRDYREQIAAAYSSSCSNPFWQKLEAKWKQLCQDKAIKSQQQLIEYGKTRQEVPGKTRDINDRTKSCLLFQDFSKHILLDGWKITDFKKMTLEDWLHASKSTIDIPKIEDYELPEKLKCLKEDYVGFLSQESIVMLEENIEAFETDICYNSEEGWFKR